MADVRRPSLWRWPAAVFVFLLVAPGARHSDAAPPPDKEHQVKAVFLYNFTQFVAWPESAFPAKDAPLIIGILGPDPFGEYLDTVVSGESAAHHPIRVRRFRNPEDVRDCHILFVRVPDGEIASLPKTLGKKGMLTVGDSRGFSQAGGMVNFIKRQGKIGLQVNLDAVKDAGLDVSSKLLRLAEIVSPARTPGGRERPGK